MPCDNQSKRRANLYFENPYCYYCGRKTRYISKQVSNQATVEHIWIISGNELAVEKTVLSCFQCNNDKSKEVQLLKNKFNYIKQ